MPRTGRAPTELLERGTRQDASHQSVPAAALGSAGAAVQLDFEALRAPARGARLATTAAERCIVRSSDHCPPHWCSEHTPATLEQVRHCWSVCILQCWQLLPRHCTCELLPPWTHTWWPQG